MGAVRLANRCVITNNCYGYFTRLNFSHASTRFEDLSQCFRGVEGGERRGTTRKGFDRLICQLPAAEDPQCFQLSERGYGFDGQNGIFRSKWRK